MKVGINGFGRMGRLAMRAGIDHPELELVAVNEPGAPAETMALLLEFDSTQGRWDRSASGSERELRAGEARLAYTREWEPAAIPWRELGVELVLECSGRFRTRATLEPHLARGARRVVVSAPVKDAVPHVVLGVNDREFDLAAEPIVSAASCTTNCLAPIVRVLHDAIGIESGLVTTIHAPTNTQRVHDAPHSDPRRARASQLSLIPTSTNSAATVGRIVPELAGRLDSVAVRAPVLSASLTDCVFQLARDTSVDEVNGALELAARQGPLAGILGYESRPLVGIDFARDPRSAIIDALSTRVTAGRLVKVLAWYDNEQGYAKRLVELAALVARASAGEHARA